MFLIQEYGKAGVDLDTLIGEQIHLSNEHDKTLPEDQRVYMTREMALEEVVAEACSRMLVDTNAGKKLAAWGRKSEANAKFVQKLKDMIYQLIIRLRKALKGADPGSLSAEAFTKLDGKVKKILSDMFVDMSTTAAERLGTIKSANMLKEINTTMEGGVRYAIAGTESMTADMQSLADAKKQIKDGVDPETIRKETGWFQGYDGMWRYEISDKDMEIDTHGKFHTNPDIRRYNELVNKVYFGDGTATNAEIQELQSLKQNLKGVNMEPDTLGKLVKHDALFFAYPQLNNIPIKFADISERGRYSPATKTITIRNDLKADKSQLARTLVHEIQHAIQDIEGFTGGASAEYWRNMGIPENKLAEYYEKTAGEIEARDVATRKDLSAEYIKQNRPDIDRTDVVLADSTDNLEYIGDTKDGRRCYKSGFDSSVPMDDRIAEFKKRIATIFNLGAVELKTDVKKIRIRGDRFTAKKNLHGDIMGQAAEIEAKVNALYDLADILATAKYDPNAKSIEQSFANPAIPPKNKAHKDVKYWYKFRNEIVFDGVPFTVTFNIRDKGVDQYQYLIDFNENKTPGLNNTAVKSLLPADQVSYDDSIRNPNEKVKQISTTDSDGNQLTVGQIEFFKDSKVRDENGNLLVVYHGTNAVFTVFDKRKAKLGAFGKGFYFAPTAGRAKAYGSAQIMETYLNVRNPYVVKDSLGFTIEDYRQMQKEFGIKDKITDNNVMQVLKNQRYDGIMVEDTNGNLQEVVVFEPTQIKSVDNKNPTDNPDIRYRLAAGPDLSARTLLTDPTVEGKNDAQKLNLQRYRDAVAKADGLEAYRDDVQARYDAMTTKQKKSAEGRKLRGEINKAENRLKLANA